MGDGPAGGTAAGGPPDIASLRSGDVLTLSFGDPDAQVFGQVRLAIAGIGGVVFGAIFVGGELVATVAEVNPGGVVRDSGPAGAVGAAGDPAGDGSDAAVVEAAPLRLASDPSGRLTAQLAPGGHGVAFELELETARWPPPVAAHDAPWADAEAGAEAGAQAGEGDGVDGDGRGSGDGDGGGSGSGDGGGGPSQPPAPAADGRAPAFGAEHFTVRAGGHASVGDRRIELQATGQLRIWRPEPEQPFLVRELDAWFASGRATSLLAVRASGRGGHDREVVQALVTEGPDHVPGAIDDPRLSTTYGPDEEPRRAGLELWATERSDYARRGSGAARLTASAVTDTIGSGRKAYRLRYDCAFMAWRMQGDDGVGPYALVRTVSGR